MAKKIIVKINMFSMNQSIYQIDENEKVSIIAEVPIDSLSKTIYSLAGPSNENIEEIELDGPSDYIQKFGFDILEGLEKNYSNTNVRIKINGKIFN